MIIEDERLAFAIKLAKEAGTLAVNMRAKQNEGFVQTKGVQDFVTEADIAAERFIREQVAKNYPDDTVLGEEDGGEGTLDKVWIVDPIDGTTNFMRGLPEWGVSIAYIADGHITHGVIYLPDLDNMAYARKGQGAYLNDQAIHVSKTKVARDAIVAVGSSAKTELAHYISTIEALLAQGFVYRRNGAACFELVSVAAGRLDAYSEEYLNCWDAMAGLLLVEEAGGKCSTRPLAEFVMRGGPILATNGQHELHGQLLDIIATQENAEVG